MSTVDPWGDPVDPPNNGVNPWAGEREPSGRSRSPWQPNAAPYVLTRCGHVALEWAITRRLQQLAPLVWCDDCQEWVTYERTARVPELANLPLAEQLPIAAPF